MMYSRRFEMGKSRYMTNCHIEDNVVIMKQTERFKGQEPYHSVVVLTVEDFKNMVKKLDIK